LPSRSRPRLLVCAAARALVSTRLGAPSAAATSPVCSAARALEAPACW
jgi:hypothetical protein